MKKAESNYAYIDGANLHKGIGELGWKLDYARFRRWLSEKYGVARAYLFLGFISKNKNLYTHLQEAGFTLVFKETTLGHDGMAKGNCDAELVLHAVSDAYEKKFEKAVIVSGDGDFACLATFLKDKTQLEAVLCPNYKKASFLLRKVTAKYIFYLDRFQNRLQYLKP